MELLKFITFLAAARQRTCSKTLESSQYLIFCLFKINFNFILHSTRRVLKNFLPVSLKTKNIKLTVEQAMKAQKRSRRIALFSLTSVLHRVGWSSPRPGRFTPGKETRYPLYKRLL